MSAEWQFYLQQPTDPIRNPISGEFFSTEAVGDVTHALIREGIQNTLDARKKNLDGSRQPAQTRIFLSEMAGAMSPARARRWFGSLWPHLTAPGNGLSDQPAYNDACPFIVFEDFGTIGLTGDDEEHTVVHGVPNHFLNFFRAEGHSDKGDQDRGSWGVGKTVFPRASRISSFLALTVRNDDGRELLLGRSILKYHRLDGQAYKSDGYFGLRRSDGFMLPTCDPATLAEFRNEFCIKRRSESGLSIVVPWYETNADDSITPDRVIAAVLHGFFYPILIGHLSVIIATPAGEILLNASSIVPEVESIGGSLALELLPVIRLAEWAQNCPPSEFLSLIAPAPDRGQNWTPELVPHTVIAQVRESLTQRRRVALTVPMAVQPRNNSPKPTFFKLFLEQSEEDSEKPVFIRDELIISDVKSPIIPKVRSLVIVEDGPLATFLRDAETPAHTQWNQGTSKFKNKYKFGPAAIRFVRRSVSELVRIINQAEQRPDPMITIDFFSVQPSSDRDDMVPTPQHRPRPAPGPGPAPPQSPLPSPRPRRFRIDKLRGGFSIRPGDAGAPLPPFIGIRVAYDVRRGNPLGKYHQEDFDLGRAPIRWGTQFNGCQVESASGNKMCVAVTSSAFHLDVVGFDPDRDLYVKAQVQEAADVD